MKAGDKVVCVDDTPGVQAADFEFVGGYLVKGLVYCVEMFLPAGSRHENFWVEEDRVFISGHKAIDGEFGTDTPWQARRFRLVSEVGHPPIAVEQPAELEASIQ